MKKLFAGIFLSAAVFQSYASLEFYDSFNYAAGSGVSAAGTPTWTLRTGTPDPTITTGSLSYPGLQTASGDNSVLFNGTAGNGIATHTLSQTYNIANAPTVYYSLTFKVTSIAIGDWGGTPGNFTNGSFMMGFSENISGTLNNPNVAAPLLIRTGDPFNVSGTANDFQGFQLGTGVTAVSPGSVGHRVFDNSTVYNPGDTLFLVLSYTFGAGANDDIARLWVNPIPGTPEILNTPKVTATGVSDVVNSQVRAFFLRNNTVEPAGTQIDDLRIGTSWNDVVVAVPEPSTIALGGIVLAGLLFGRRFRK